MRTILRQFAIHMQHIRRDSLTLVTIVVLFLCLRVQNVSAIPLIRAQGVPLAEVIYSALGSEKNIAMLYVPAFLLMLRNMTPRRYDAYVISKAGVRSWTAARVLSATVQAAAYAALIAMMAALSVFPAWLPGGTRVEAWFSPQAGQGIPEDSVLHALTPCAGAAIQLMQLTGLLALIGLVFNWLTLKYNPWAGIALTLMMHFLLYALMAIPAGRLSGVVSYRWFMLSGYAAGWQIALWCAAAAALALAQAMMEEPEILILDEPMNGIDREGVEEIVAILAEEKAKGRTILMASHIPGDIERIADEIYVMEGGALTKEEK